MNTAPVTPNAATVLASYIHERGLPINESLFKCDLKAFLQTGETLTGMSYTKTGPTSVVPENAPTIQTSKTMQTLLSDAFTLPQRDIIGDALMDRRDVNEIVLLDILNVGEKIPMSIGIVPMKPLALSPREKAQALELVKRWVGHMVQEHKG